ncbi:hypothetical protein CCP4SC76_1890019 [Gammaproteobacteria bacterium]
MWKLGDPSLVGSLSQISPNFLPCECKIVLQNQSHSLNHSLNHSQESQNDRHHPHHAAAPQGTGVEQRWPRF